MNLKVIVMGVAVMLGLSACSDGPAATKALQGAGYTDIHTTGYAFFGCDEKDTFHTGFIAKGPTGQHVEGVVCSGWLKGATIRTE